MDVIDRGLDLDLDRPTEAVRADDGRETARPDVPVVVREAGESYPEMWQRAVAGWDRRRKFDAPLEELAGFKPELAGLPEVSAEGAGPYIKRHRDDRPWLREAEDSPPEVQRIIAACDLGGAHAHIRHEGWVREDANMNRAAKLEDPAQLDQGKRERGIDGLRARKRDHVSAELATRVTDPAAFATAYKRGSEHPDVQAAVNGSYPPDTYPRDVSLTIASLLGNEGHEFCTGWVLKLKEGESVDDAKDRRLEWRDAVRDGSGPDGPGPAVQPVPTFEGGTMIFRIAPRKDGNGYTVASMFPHPREDVLLRAMQPEIRRETR